MLGFIHGGFMLELCRGWSLHGPHVGQRRAAIDRDDLVTLVQVRAAARDARLVERLGQG
jgi:hypothetical protein